MAAKPAHDELQLQSKRRAPTAGASGAGRASSARLSRDPAACGIEAAAATAGDALGGTLGGALGGVGARSAEFGELQHKRFDLRGFADRQPAELRGTHERQVWRSSHDPSISLPGAAPAPPARTQWGGPSAGSSPAGARGGGGDASLARAKPSGRYPHSLSGGAADALLRARAGPGADAGAAFADSPRSLARGSSARRQPMPTSRSTGASASLTSPRHAPTEPSARRAQPTAAVVTVAPATDARAAGAPTGDDASPGRAMVEAMSAVDIDSVVALGGKGGRAARNASSESEGVWPAAHSHVRSADGRVRSVGNAAHARDGLSGAVATSRSHSDDALRPLRSSDRVEEDAGVRVRAHARAAAPRRRWCVWCGARGADTWRIPRPHRTHLRLTRQKRHARTHARDAPPRCLLSLIHI